MKKFFLLIMSTVLISFSTTAQTDVSGTIGINSTWTSSGSPYTVTGNVIVNEGVTLTIEIGTVVQFNSSTYIQVFGTLNANSATFTANASTTPGFWQGIYVGYDWNAAIADVTLNGCTVEYAQSLHVRKGSMILSNNTVLNNFSASGVDIYTLGTLDISHTTIQNCSYPVYFRGNGHWSVGEGIELTGNTNDYIFINFRDVNSTFNCPDAGIPYYYDSELRVTETGSLLISEGVEFLGTTSAYINVFGKIKSQGTVTDSVTFGKVPSVDYWSGINIQESAIDTACIFSYSRFTGAKYVNSYRPSALGTCAVEIDKSSPVFNNCAFNSNNYNLIVKGQSTPVFTNCSFDESIVVSKKISNINVDMNADPVFNNCSIAFNEQEGRAIGIIGSTVYDDSHFTQLLFTEYTDLPFVLFGNVIIQDTASLTIDAGLVFKCADNDYYILVNGELNAIGTSTEPIVFTHINDDDYGTPSDTYNDGSTTINYSSSGMILLRGEATSHLEYWKILYAGRSYNNYAVEMKNNSILKNSIVKNSYWGVLFSENAQLVNNSFENINNYPIARQMDGGSPSLIDNSVSNTGYVGVYVNGFDSGDYSIGGMDFAGNTNVAYGFNDRNVNIPVDANVTILPGTVLKFNGYWSSRLTVLGGLKAEGTSSNKIIFTSIYDNSVSGNTNNNSGADPTSYKWDRFVFDAGSNDTFNSLKNVEVRYYRESVLIDNCNVAVDASVFNFSESYGLSILGDAAPVISNSEFNNIGNAPIQMDMFANPVFSGNSIANVAKFGISIHGSTIAGTVPIRNFAGYTNITYLLDENIRVDDELIIPAGVVFKGSGDKYIDVYGKLTVQGASGNPVVFTSVEDDAYGNPTDTQQNGVSAAPNKQGCHVVFRQSADDASVVDNTLFRYMYNHGVYTMDASPTISNCTFYDVANEGVMLRGTSSPSITNCVFEDVPFPMTIDPTSYPATATGNQLTGNSGRAIQVVDNATLTQDATLDKHSFAGVDNIPYLFYRYTIGTSAVLTVKPGVVCKFRQNGYLNVRKGLIADGGATVDSTIVFTSDRDDFYGGDTFGDGDATVANNRWWYGINFLGEAIDALCLLDNCVIKNGTRNYSNSVHSYNRGGITLNNSSPTIHNTLFEDNYWGLLVRNTSVPDIDNCDFVGTNPTYGYGIWNETGSVTVVAENCWWNDDTGPYNATSNASGEGERVSDNVDFDPWISQPAQPMMGDVSLNGEVMPYDASLVLQSSVGNITLSTKQQGVADVSFDESISSYDASLILQYTIGSISNFGASSGAAAMYKSGLASLSVDVSVPFTKLDPQNTKFDIPVSFYTTEKVKSMDIQISTNPNHIRFIKLNTNDIPSGIMEASGYDENTGVVKISVASSKDLDLNNNNITLVFEIKDGEQGESDIKLDKLTVNETLNEATFTVTVSNSALLGGIDSIEEISAFKIYSTGSICKADITLTTAQTKLTISVYNTIGQLTNKVVVNGADVGQNSFTFKTEKSGVKQSSKIYIVIVAGDNFIVTRKLIVK